MLKVVWGTAKILNMRAPPQIAQTIQGSLQNDHPENTGSDCGETAVHEEPITRTLIRNTGETEGTVPTS